MKDSNLIRELVERKKQSIFATSTPFAASRDGIKDLSPDQPKTAMSESVTRTASEKMAAGETHYADIAGIEPLKERVCSLLSHLGAEVNTDQTLITAGEQETRFLAISSQSFHGDAEKVAISQVAHPGARQAAAFRRMGVIDMSVDEQLQPTRESIEKALESGADVIYLESPNRFTGKTLDESFMNFALDAAKSAGAVIVWDQGLAPWVGADEYQGILSFGVTDHVRAIGAAAPGLGMDSWPLGYIASSAEALNKEVRLLKQMICICTSTISQWGAVAAYDDCSGRMDELIGSLRDKKSDAEEVLCGANGVEIIESPTCSHLTVKFDSEKSYNRAKAALSEKGFAFTDGSSFGADNMLRLTTTTCPEGIVKAAEILRKGTVC